MEKLKFTVGMVFVSLFASSCFALESSVPAGIPRLNHVFVIMMENHSYADIRNNTSAPFINNMADTSNVAANYVAVGHPSLTNYLEIVGGSNFNVLSDNAPDWHSTSCTPFADTGTVCPIDGSGTENSSSTPNIIGKTIAEKLFQDESPIGKEVRVLVLARPPRDEEAKAAGAEHAGLAEYIQKIQAGWADIDVIIATPDVMGEVGKLGKVLGPRGLMPNPKSGTVTNEVAKAVREVKPGKIKFRVDKSGILHASVGKAKFESTQLVDNIRAFLNTVVRLRPSTAKGTYIKSISLSSTMGPGVAVDRTQVAAH